MPAHVFTANLRTTYRRNIPHKIEELLRRSGIADRVCRGDRVAVKLHFGERGNTSFIRPVLVRRVVELIRELGGRPFLTDANTLYTGSRSDAVAHLETATRNGFAYAVVDAPLVIADGLRGTDGVSVEVPGTHFDRVSVASAVAHADAIVVLSHFKGHDLAGIGGALKNLGMGCATREGKMAQHSELSPKVKRKRCIGCGACLPWCAHGAITVEETAAIDPERCVGCAECILTCPQQAIQIRWATGPGIMQEKMAEHACGALANKKDRAVFLNAVTQVSPACDCHRHNDAPIVSDLGFASSIDPVALDQACADWVNGQPGNPDSALTGGLEPGGDKFRGVYPNIDWTAQLSHAQALGVGTRSYERISIDD